MKPLSHLSAAGLLVLIAACQDGATGPDASDVPDAPEPPTANGNPSNVIVRAEHRDADGTITYSVRVRSDSATLSSFQGAVSFAPGSVEYQSHSPASVPNGVVLVNVNDVAGGQIRFSSYTHTRYEAATTGVEVFRFTVVSSGESDPVISGTLAFTGTSVASSAAGAESLAATVSSADAACLGTSRWGDGNGDDAVNITDAQQLARYSTGLVVGNPAAVSTRGDVTADGIVNIVDAQQVARYSVGLTSAARTNTWIC